MTNEIEANPAQPEKVEVPPTASLIQCQTCGVPTARKGPNSKFCDGCKPARKVVAQQKKIDKKKASSFVYDSGTEPTKPEAKRLLQERGLGNEHVIDFCYDIALVAAELNRVTPNRFYFQNGLRKTLASYEAKAPQPLEAIPHEEVAGELLNKAELYALYCFGFWRQPDVTFDQWLADRLKFKSSAFELSKILGKQDFGKKHEEWTRFAPRWNPIGLNNNYTQREALQWLDSQQSDTEGDKKHYLLVASRNSMKSTWARIHALCLTLICPDAALLLISETNRLTREAMIEWKGYVEMAPHSPTLFQQYFGEATIPPDSGQALKYYNPLAHLKLPYASLSQNSMQGASTGSRFWYCIFDDPVSDENFTANEEQRAAGLRKYSAILALGEPAAFTLTVQTPWIEEDLADVRIKRNALDPEHPLAVRIDPVMEIKPEARGKGLLELQEEDVVLNFLPKLNWRFVRRKMTDAGGIEFFKTQYLCQWIKEDEGITVTFTEEALRSKLRPRSFFDATALPGTPVYLSLDRAWSQTRTADFSSLALVRCQPVGEESRKRTNALVVLDVILGRWKESELILNIGRAIEKYNPSAWVLEEDRGHEELVLGVRKLRHGLVMPHVILRKIKNTDHAKALKIKILEAPLQDSRLWFTTASWNDLVFQNFIRFDGHRKSASSDESKDDSVDSIATAYQVWGPRATTEVIDPEEAQKRHQEEEEEGARERRRHFHNAMFGVGQSWTPPPPPTEVVHPTQQSNDPRSRVLNFPRLIKRNDDSRHTLFGSRGKWEKT